MDHRSCSGRSWRSVIQKQGASHGNLTKWPSGNAKNLFLEHTVGVHRTFSQNPNPEGCSTHRCWPWYAPSIKICRGLAIQLEAFPGCRHIPLSRCTADPTPHARPIPRAPGACLVPNKSHQSGGTPPGPFLAQHRKGCGYLVKTAILACSTTGAGPHGPKKIPPWGFRDRPGSPFEHLIRRRGRPASFQFY